jgi:hypothetical protein
MALYPDGNLLIDNSNGYIFGTTPTGGVYGLGNVYALTPPTGSETEGRTGDLFGAAREWNGVQIRPKPSRDRSLQLHRPGNEVSLGGADCCPGAI